MQCGGSPHYHYQARLEKFVSLWRGTEAVADKVVLLGPVTDGTWCRPLSWGMAADICFGELSGVLHFGMERMWAQMGKSAPLKFGARGDSGTVRIQTDSVWAGDTDSRRLSCSCGWVKTDAWAKYHRALEPTLG